MKRLLYGAVALALLASVAGCNSSGTSGAGSAATRIAADINTINGALTSPAAQQAVANIKALGMTAACLISGAAAKAQTLNAALAPLLSAKQAAGLTRINTNVAIVGVVESSLCTQLGGTVTVS